MPAVQLPPVPHVATARYAGFVAGADGQSFRHVHRAFRSEWGTIPRTILVALFRGWDEGRECRQNAFASK
jgi:hypothetical protein